MNDELWNAVYQLGTDDATSASPPAVAKLCELGIAERGEPGPRLTPYGERAFVVLESGDGFVPELDEPGGCD